MTDKIDIFESGDIIPGNVEYKTLPPYKEVFMAYIDILGYKNLLKNHGSSAPQVLNQLFIQIIDWNKSMYKHIKLSLLSDAIIATTQQNHPAEFFNLHNVVQTIARTLLQNKLLCRGAFVLGEHSQHEDMIVSPALVEAYNLEQNAGFPRLLVSDKVIKKIFPSIKEVENAPHLHKIEYGNQNRFIDKNILCQDDEDLLWIVDFFSCEPLYCLKHKKTMNHWPNDPEPTDTDLKIFYDQAINRAQIFRNDISEGLANAQNIPIHYRKWLYLARKYNNFLVSAEYLKESDRLNLFIKLN